MMRTAAVRTVADIVLEAFSPRGLRLVEADLTANGDTRVRFDLEGYRFDLIVEEVTPQTLVLELCDVLRVDSARYPGAMARTFELANYLHGRVDHVRFLIDSAAPGPADRRLARVSPVLEDDDDGEHGALISVSFSAPLFDGRPERLVEAFDLGVDALLYALGRMQDELLQVGVSVFETRSRRGLGDG